ncbi:hypothetical protein GCM10022254_41840 [Actinomadura meridiana]|uniref:Uncharacterized protein n=1 Tax=Actinomadura meridiana TaxID=559626 RepID=A0ABP8C7N6_9ACTN
MEPAPIRDGAIRPEGRPCRALPPALVRLMAVAGLAFAGWMALSALNNAAHAAQPNTAQPNTAQPNTAAHMARIGVPDQGAAAVPSRPTETGADSGSGSDSADARGTGDLIARPLGGGRTVRSLGSRVDGVTGAVGDQELGDHPLQYVRDQRQDVFDDKDRVIHRVQSLGDSAGIPQVRVTGVEPAPVVRGVTRGIVDADPADGLQPSEPVTPEPEKAASGDHAGARAKLGTVAPPLFTGHADGSDQGGCAGCRGDRHGPVLPAGQDEPWSGSGGGHQLSPVADLMRGGRYPAVTAAVDTSMLDRTALTDVFAPGGPSVVPD